MRDRPAVNQIKTSGPGCRDRFVWTMNVHGLSFPSHIAALLGDRQPSMTMPTCRSGARDENASVRLVYDLRQRERDAFHRELREKTVPFTGYGSAGRTGGGGNGSVTRPVAVAVRGTVR